MSNQGYIVKEGSASSRVSGSPRQVEFFAVKRWKTQGKFRSHWKNRISVEGSWLSLRPLARSKVAGKSRERPLLISQMNHWRLRWCQSSDHPWHPLLNHEIKPFCSRTIFRLTFSTEKNSSELPDQKKNRKVMTRLYKLYFF